MKIVIGITGASGSIYGVRFVERCPGEKYLIASEWGERVLMEETGTRMDDLAKHVEEVYTDDDLMAPVSSGSFVYDACVIIPCSVSTLGKIATGIADTLMTLVAGVCLKERRKLVLCVREAPWSSVALEQALKLSNLGVTIMPASPPFYTRPKTLDEAIDGYINKVLIHLSVPVDWGWKHSEK